MEGKHWVRKPRSALLKRSADALPKRGEQAVELALPETRRTKPESGQLAPADIVFAKEQKRQFSLLNELPAIVYLRAPDYAIHFANRHFRQRFGDPTSEPCYKLIHNRTAPCVPCGCATALTEGRPQQSEWVFADGTTYQLYDYPFVDVDGVEKVLHLGIDITQRKQAEAELERVNRDLLALSRADRRQRLLAEGLAQAALALNSSLDADQVLDRVLEQILRVVPCTAATVLLVENQQIRLVRQHGLESRLSAKLALSRSGMPLESFPYLQSICRECQPLLIQDATREPQARLFGDLEWVRSLALLPMIQGNSVDGFIALLSDRDGAFTRESILGLGSFASHAALAIENARLYQHMKESREQLQSLSRRLVEVQENERRTVARELHDEAGQALTSLMIQLKLLQRNAADPVRVRDSINELIGEVESVMGNLHRVAMDLRPASLDHLGLIAALQQHCETLADQHGIRITLEAIGIESRVASGVETDLYRIVQEALNNVVRHAQATRVDVLLERRGDCIVVIVEDDGRGFEPEIAVGPDHLGLVGIQERAMAIGGSMTIESTPSHGATIIVEVPNGSQSSDR